jgi:hypothetical protein
VISRPVAFGWNVWLPLTLPQTQTPVVNVSSLYNAKYYERKTCMFFVFFRFFGFFVFFGFYVVAAPVAAPVAAAVASTGRISFGITHP